MLTCPFHVVFMEVFELPEVQAVPPIKENLGETIIVLPPQLMEPVKRTLSRSTTWENSGSDGEKVATMAGRV